MYDELTVIFLGLIFIIKLIELLDRIGIFAKASKRRRTVRKK